MDHTTHPKPRESSDGDFNMGEDISCKVCSGKIIIAEGYFTCMDICDFDVHKNCYGGKTYEELDLNCPYNHPMPKREPGFTKRLKAIQGQDVQESALQVQFCNACDSNVITFSENPFYTCSQVCDIFVCTSCAECINGHPLKWAKNMPLDSGSGVLNCSRCSE